MPYTSSNDEHVRAHYLKRDADAVAADRERKRKARNRERIVGVLDAVHLKDIRLAGKRRILRVRAAMQVKGAPRYLAMLTADSLVDLYSAWIGRETLRGMKTKANAPSIARWIVAEGRRNTSSTLPALATRVSKDLKRIARLEGLHCSIDGAPLISPFDPITEFQSV